MPSPAESPYVGSRHFERSDEDRRRFFGRDPETEELVALVLSHNAVLVYAASGAGKSSLINAGAIPKLVEEGFEVLPRGRIGVALPRNITLGDTNPYVLNLLASLSPEADIAALARTSITDYLRALPRRDAGAGRVLVIDQAEELFTFLPRGWQRHQRGLFLALRDALRDAPELRLVLVTREDYLARFDDLAPLLPGALRVRMHLEPLARSAARDAVERPLAATRWRFDAGVAEQLVTDLSRMKVGIGTGDVHDEPGPYVEPVQLQIVCSALWGRLPAGVDIITAKHLHQFGDVENTLERFYEDTIEACVRETGCDKEQLARWFSDELITPAGTRGQVFRGPTDTGGLANHVVAFLDASHLVRADERASGRWYELAHDRLVRPIRTVNERWTLAFDDATARRRARRTMRRRTVAALAALVVLGAVIAAFVMPRLQARATERALTIGRIDDLVHECGPAPTECRDSKVRIFDVVADYYWRHDRIAELVAVLQNRAAWIPPDYGMPVLAEVRSGDRASEPDVLRIEYNPARPVDEWRMRAEWARQADELGRRWGLPVIRHIVLAPDPRVAVSSVQIVASPESCSASRLRSELSWRVTMPTAAGEALISRSDIAHNDRLLRFFEDYSRSDGWKQYEDLKLDGPWWFVPAWTLPVWRVGGRPAVSREAVLATVVAGDLLDHPELVLGCSALETLLGTVAGTAPVALREALAARGLEGLRLDLIELVRSQRRSLAYLPMVLDVLAKHPGLDAAHAAKAADHEIASGDRSDEPLHGPWRTGPLPGQAPGQAIDRDRAERSSAYRDVVEQLPEAHGPLRAWLGPDARAALETDRAPNEDLARQLDDGQRTLYLRHGIVRPDLKIVPTSANGARVEALNQTAASPGVALDMTRDAGAQLIRTVDARSRELRVWWLTPERLQWVVSALRPGERAWLAARYSITDLTRIARAVVSGDDKDGADTVRDLPWLLRSLVFWAHARNAASVPELAAAFRDLQRARLKPGTAAEGDARITAAIDPGVRRGIAALDADRPRDAEAAFTAVIRGNRDAAVAAFLAQYPATSALDPARRTRMLAMACRLPTAHSKLDAVFKPPDRSVEHELEDLLAAPGAPVTAAERARFEACVLWSLGQRDARPARPVELARRWSALLAGTRPDSWTSNEAVFVARHWLESHGHDAAAQDGEVAAARQLLVHGLTAVAPGDAIAAWQGGLRDALGRPPPRWARDLIADVADALPAGWPSLRLEIAGWLADFGGADAQRANRLVSGVAPGRTAADLWQQWWWRASILEHVAEDAAPAQRAEWFTGAADALRSLAQIATTADQLRRAFVALAWLGVRSGDDAAVRAAIEGGTTRGVPDAAFDPPRFLVALGSGDAPQAREIAARMVHAAPDDGAAQYADAAAAVLTRRDDLESAARAFIFGGRAGLGRDADDIRLLLYWALIATPGREADARQLLDQRMAEIHPASWPARLRQRDAMVWREMLVAYVAGAIPASQIFDPLANDAALRRSGLDQTELALDSLRCEAHFYAALREQITGAPATREPRSRDHLRHAVATGRHAAYEYRMAQYLLARLRT